MRPQLNACLFAFMCHKVSPIKSSKGVLPQDRTFKGFWICKIQSDILHYYPDYSFKSTLFSGQRLTALTDTTAQVRRLEGLLSWCCKVFLHSTPAAYQKALKQGFWLYNASAKFHIVLGLLKQQIFCQSGASQLNYKISSTNWIKSMKEGALSNC